MALTIDQVQDFNWQADPLELFSVVERLHKVLNPPTFGANQKYCYDKDLSSYVLAWSDSGDYIGRAFQIWKKSEGEGQLQDIKGGDTPLTLSWWKLDLSAVPVAATMLLQHYHALHIANWISTLDDVLSLKLPDNSWKIQEGLYFSPQGTLIFAWGSHTYAFKPLNLGVSQPRNGMKVPSFELKRLKIARKKSVVSAAQS